MIPPHPVPGDSIYRTITNRLTQLEANSTLVMRFVEQQTLSIREALRRLEEDVGRLDGIVRAPVSLAGCVGLTGRDGRRRRSRRCLRARCLSWSASGARWTRSVCCCCARSRA